jgi:hypothetical protein
MAFYVAVLSAVIITLQAIFQSKPARGLRWNVLGTVVTGTSLHAAAERSYVEAHGGWTILSFQVARFLAVAALCALSAFTVATSNMRPSFGWASMVVASVRSPRPLFTTPR